MAARGASHAQESPRRPNGPASPSPVTDGEHVYAFFQDFGFVAFTADGRERWRLSLGPFNQFYGFGASPILVDDTLLLAVDQDSGSYLLGVDTPTGRVRYQVARPGVISGYSTPTCTEPGGGPKQVVIPESFQLSAYAVENGTRLWWVRGLACEMKSVASTDGETLYVNGWGFPDQPGQQVPTVPFAEGLGVRPQRRRPVADTEITGETPMDKMLAAGYGFKAFDSIATAASTPASGTSSARCWDRRTVCSPSGWAAAAT